MAGPFDTAAASRIEEIRRTSANIEDRITRLLAVQNDLLEAQRAGTAARTAAYDRTVTQINDILSKTNSATSSSRGLTTATNDYGASVSRAGQSTSATSTMMGGMSAAVDAAMKGTSLLSSQMQVYRENLDNLAAPHVNMATLMKNLAGGSLATYRAIGTNNEGLKEYYKLLGDTSAINKAGGFQDAQLKILEKVNSTNVVFSKAGDIIPDLMKKMTGIAKASDDKPAEFLEKFNAQGQSFVEVMGGELNVLEGFANVFNDVQLSAAFSRDQLSKSTDEISESIAKTGFAIKAYNITNGDVTEMIRRNYIITGKATTDYFDQVVDAAEKSSLAFGISSEQIVKDTLDMMNNVQMFGFRTPEEFARISKAAQDSHASISELAGIMGKFDTFETAASAVGDLNATLGTNFDAVELMTLKYTDPVKMLQRLGEGFRETGMSFDDMFMAPEKLPFLTSTLNTLGVTAEQLRSMYEGSASATDIIKQQSDASKEVAESNIDIDELMKSRITLMQGVAKNTDDMMRRLDQSAQFLAGSSRDAVKSANEVNTRFLELSNSIVSRFATAQKDMIEKAAASYKMIVEEVLDALNKKIAQSVGIIKTAKDEFEALLDQQQSQAMQAAKMPTPASTTPTQPTSTLDVALSPGSPTRVSRAFGGLFEDYILDSRDALLAGPPKMLDAILTQAKAMKEFIERSAELSTEPTVELPPQDLVIAGPPKNLDGILAQAKAVKEFVEKAAEISAEPVAELPKPTRPPPPTAATLPTQLQARLQPVGSTINISIDSASFIQYIMETMSKEYPV